VTNPYEEGSVRYHIRDKTTELKDLVVDDIKQEWQKIPEGARQSISKGASEFAQGFGTAWEGTKRIDNKYDPTEYAAAGTAYALEGIGAGFDWLTNQVAQKTGVDPAVVAVGEMFVPWSKLGKLGKLGKVGKVSKVSKVAKVTTNLNDLKAFSFATKVDNLTGGNVKSEVMQMLSKGGDNLDGIFSGRTNQLITDYKAKYPNREIYARTNIDEAVDIRKGLKAKGEKVPYFLDLTDNRLKFVVKKGTDYYGPGKHRYAFDDLSNKLANEANKRAIKLSKTIPIEDYIKELGPIEGTKAFNFNKKKMAKLYRWVSEEGAHLDHIWPLVSTKTEGFHHINNLILLYSKHNLKKSNKILPKALFEELDIPLTKRDLIRSTLQKPAKTNKVKRQRIIETLIELDILEMK
jgi:hypothetical protein